MKYEWEKDLESYTSKENIKKLVQLVDGRIIKGQKIKWSVIVLGILSLTLFFLFIGVLNVLNIGRELRVGFVQSIITFGLAVVTFRSPIQSSKITAEEVDLIVDKHVTGDIMKKICKTVEQKTSGIEKWLAFTGACGTGATWIITLLNL